MNGLYHYSGGKLWQRKVAKVKVKARGSAEMGGPGSGRRPGSGKITKTTYPNKKVALSSKGMVANFKGNKYQKFSLKRSPLKYKK